MSHSPLNKSKEDYQETINRISSEQSAVGIDAQYTHAIIIEYLKDIDKRLQRVEKTIQK